MDRFKKIILIAIAAAYVISPVDAIGGPVDDLLVMFLTWVANRKIAAE